ncbi:Protein-lysine N-methyltransferase EEF2KMT [Grifola frondosa]|uniref:Protein-lysine N-methyltransferase EEF2KMT n=1 Tax=Grifola frondosa TaxID=5627 RepID=A0A1C7LWH3_GRIFR|nr:Protein-lysine N-methyltransferase EEF2KMT [Grifola frondosa]
MASPTHSLTPPTPPTSSLPPLSRLASHSFDQVNQALQNLRSIYCAPPISLRLSAPSQKHVIHDTSVPDSGYASAEEDEDDECPEEEEAPFDLDVLRADKFEREYAVRWLTDFTARSDRWVYMPDSESEADARAALIDEAASLLASFAGEEEEQALTRSFSFPTGFSTQHVHVELNDAPLLSEDHTSVGLQSWASSILLAERMCSQPGAFRLGEQDTELRVLELGAGTGLLSIVATKLLHSLPHASTVVATDYHTSVLSNLQANVMTNFPPSYLSTSPSAPALEVLSLDWQNPVYEGSLKDPFDIILAADVIYHPEHAHWIKRCVERLLARPSGDVDGAPYGGIFWLIIPLRVTGRHEGMYNTVEAIFPLTNALTDAASWELAILSVEQLGRHEGVGRADEGGYKLYKIGWVSPCETAGITS